MALQSVKWSSIQTNDDALKLLRSLREELDNGPQYISVPQFDECLSTMIAIRSIVYRTTYSSVGQDVLNAIKRLRTHLKDKIVMSEKPVRFMNVEKSIVPQESKFSVRSNTALIRKLVTMDQIERVLEDLKSGLANTPQQVSMVENATKSLGFSSVNELVQYATTPLGLTASSFDRDAHKLRRIEEIIAGFELLDDEKVKTKAYSTMLANTIRKNEPLDLQIGHVQIDLPVTYDLDFDEGLMEFKPLQLEKPPDPSSVLPLFEELRVILEKFPKTGATTEDKNALGQAYLRTHEADTSFKIEYSKYFIEVLEAVMCKRSVETFYATDYEAWRQHTMETLDEGMNIARAAIDSQKMEYIKLGVLCGLAAKIPAIRDTAQSTFEMFFDSHSPSDLAPLWSHIMEVSAKPGALITVVRLLIKQALSA